MQFRFHCYRTPVFAFPCSGTATRRTIRARMATSLPYPLRTDAPARPGHGRERLLTCLLMTF